MTETKGSSAVAERTTHEKPHTAHSLMDAGSAPEIAMTYAAVNLPAADINKNRHEQIAQLAHQFFIERGMEHGRAEEDWIRAEAEIRRRNEGLGIREE